ncbi:hypothetical protein A0J61_10313 [Choanephora cucurbitarum]|uniref:Uncharacterized protein n=1 Tax=Choanephora cucurbitarum TaxID=101091 RepID=A0A1C7MXV4_9FUNG|nr:hypothetical protein A0J61_10313 [Choanephora cucurbitarum]
MGKGTLALDARSMGWSHLVADGGTRVLRRIGKRYKELLIAPTTKLGGVGPLVDIDGTRNQAKYIEALSENFQPWLMKLQSKHDNALSFNKMNLRVILELWHVTGRTII